MTAAIGTPINRVDGPEKVTGARPLLGRDRRCRTWRTRRSSAPACRAGGSSSIDVRGAPLAATACWRCSPTRTVPKVASPAAPAAVAGRARPHRARASSRCRTTSCTTGASRSRSWSPTATSARSTPRRSSEVTYDRDTVGDDDRRGARRRRTRRSGCSAA